MKEITLTSLALVTAYPENLRPGAILRKTPFTVTSLVLVLTAVLFFPGAALGGDLPEPASHLSLAHGHSCIVVNNKINCWGSNHFGERDVPKTLSNPYKVSVGGQDSCALDDFYVTCWGLSGFDIISVSRAIDLSRNVYHACVIDELSLFCFGSANRYGELDIPQGLRNPRQVAAGVYHTCALDDDGVKCWGDKVMGATNVPQLDSPTQIVAGNSFSCALDSVGLICWGANDDGELNVPSLKNTKQISAGYHHACALDEYGVQCWGANGFGQTDVPALVNPTNVAAGTHHSCALDGDEVICWGYNGWGQTDPDNNLITELATLDSDSGNLKLVADDEVSSVADNDSLDGNRAIELSISEIIRTNFTLAASSFPIFGPFKTAKAEAANLTISPTSNTAIVAKLGS